MAPVAQKVRPTQLERLVTEAVGRFMPETAERRRREAADGRHFTIDHDQVSFAGTSLVTGELDLADALDLEDAIRGIAAQLADLGSQDSCDARRPPPRPTWWSSPSWTWPTTSTWTPTRFPTGSPNNLRFATTPASSPGAADPPAG